jgi:UDP-glucose 4-epimerase
VREVIRAVEEVTGRKVAVRETARRPGDPAELVANAERAGRELNWRPRYTDLRQIVETAWNWHRAHPKGYDD